MFGTTVMRVVEWGQCDPAGIVFFPRYAEMGDAATAILMERALGMPKAALVAHHDILGFPVAAHRSQYHAPCTYGDSLRIESRVVRLGTSSFDVHHRFLRGEALAIEITETRVWVVRRSDRAHDIAASPIPLEVRAKLERDGEDTSGEGMPDA